MWGPQPAKERQHELEGKISSRHSHRVSDVGINPDPAPRNSSASRDHDAVPHDRRNLGHLCASFCKTEIKIWTGLRCLFTRVPACRWSDSDLFPSGVSS